MAKPGERMMGGGHEPLLLSGLRQDLAARDDRFFRRDID